MIPVPSEISFTAGAASSRRRRSTAPEDLPTASSTPTQHFRARPAEFAAGVCQQRNFLHERRHSLPMISSIIRPASSYYYHASLGEQPLYYPPGAHGSDPSSSLDASHEVALRNHQQLQLDRLRMDQQLQREEQTRITRHLHSRRTSWPISSSSEPQDPPQEPRQRRPREEHRLVSASEFLSTADVRTLPRQSLPSTDLRLAHSHVDSRKAQDEESSPSSAAKKKKQKVSHHHEVNDFLVTRRTSSPCPIKEESTNGDDLPTTRGEDITAPSTRRSSLSSNVTEPSTRKSSLNDGNITEPSTKKSSFSGNVSEASTRRSSWSDGTVPSRLTEEVTAAAARRRQLLGLGSTFVLPGREQLGLSSMLATSSDLSSTTTMMASSLRLQSLDQKLRLLRTGLLSPDDGFGLASSSTDAPTFANVGLSSSSSSLLPTLPHSGLLAARPSYLDNVILLSHEQNILRRQALLRNEALHFLDPPLSSLPLSVEEGLLAGRRSSLYASPISSSGALLSSSTNVLPPVRLYDDNIARMRQSSSCWLPTDATLKHPEESSAPHARPGEAVDEGFREKPPSFAGRDNRSIRALPLHSALDETNVSEYQRLLRQQIELFEADEIEVQSNAQGRNKSIVLGQVGIRCRHCNHLTPKRRATGAVYFPKKLDRVYQTAQKMADIHLLKVCQFIPEGTKAQMLKVKSNFKSCVGGGKQYWGSALASRGVEETETRGLVFSSSTTTVPHQQHCTAMSSSSHHYHHHG